MSKGATGWRGLLSRLGGAAPGAQAVPVVDPEGARRAFAEATAALGQRQLDRAVRHLEDAVRLDPGLAEAQANLGAVLKDLGQPARAEPALRRALALQPGLASAAYNLATIRLRLGDWPEAAALFGQAASGMPRDADVFYWLGNAQMGCGDMQRARQAYRQALRLDPGRVQAAWGEVMTHLPAVASTQGEWQQAPARFRTALRELRATWKARTPSALVPAIGAVQPFLLAYTAGNHRDLLSEYGQMCSSIMAASPGHPPLPPPTSPRAARPRIGIVSAHVYSHSVWHALLRGWIEGLKRCGWDIVIFHTGAREDEQTAWARRQAQAFHYDAGEWQDWARRIAEVRPDVLLYPEIGMDATTLRLASLRLAHRQVASWGHPMTTGLPTMDAYVSAAALEPPDAGDHYTEQLIRLPGIGCHYLPYGTRPEPVDRARWKLAPEDRILLCPGTPYKYTPNADALWTALARLPQCKLVFFRAANTALAQRLELRLREAFKTAGLDFDDKVRMVPWQSQAGFFGWLDEATAFLDTVGFSGFNTVLQAVERACPVVAFEGAALRGRFASGVLRALQLDAYVAASTDAYLACVQGLLESDEAREHYRLCLRERAPRLWGDTDNVRTLDAELRALLADAPPASAAPQ